MQMRSVVLIDFVRGEIAAIDVAGEAGFEGGANLAELFKDDAFEERMGADVCAAVLAGVADAGGCVAKEAGGGVVSFGSKEGGE